jgi:hypothetical protein
MKKSFFFIFFAAFFFASACKSKKVLPAEWKRVTLGNLGLSVEAPFVFKEKDVQDKLTPEVKKLVKDMDSFFEEQGDDFYGAMVAEYTDGVTISVEGAMDGAIQEMINTAKAKVENRKDEEKIINGNKVNYTIATLARTTQDKMELQIAILSKGQRIFQIMGLYKPQEDEVRKIVKRIIGSIEIKP